MSEIRASGVKRTNSRVGAADMLAPRSRVIGALGAGLDGAMAALGALRCSATSSDAVWNEAGGLRISTAPITPACNSTTSAPRLDDQASVRGDNLEKNSEIEADMRAPADGLRSGSASIAANSFCMARAEGAPRLSLRPMVSAYSSRMTAYCRASSGSEASASSTRRASRALSVPAAYQGSSISTSSGS